MPLALYKHLKKHKQGTYAHSLPQIIVRVILIDFSDLSFGEAYPDHLFGHSFMQGRSPPSSSKARRT